MYLYRYIDISYGSMIDDDHGGGHCWDIRVLLKQFFVYKETPCGYWIGDHGVFSTKYRRWVSKTSRKRFAHASRDDAWTSYLARKDRQIAIYKAKLERAQIARRCSRPDVQTPACDDPTIQTALSKFKEVLNT